ncbi:peptidoglycan DD-metalloendopeptidase family protein [Neobacillus sp. D3-1R]|uniref:peptidoglycan DD-metalloendopeptidase family protein n=1 Tax=Neobacillus sp. D3-1R TaxID=3445778 RepID=UPI003F9EDAA9
MLDYLKRLLIAGIMAICVSLLFFGGKPQAAELNNNVDWIWPTEGIISDTYGTRFGHHKGVDIASHLNTPIFSVDDGTVTKSYYSDTYGQVIFIKHNNNFETVYAHLNKRLVKEGDQVKKGEKIGQMGNTGSSTGVHLHFEVHQNEWTFEKENALNPTVVLGDVQIGYSVQSANEGQAEYVVKNISPLTTESGNDVSSNEKSVLTLHTVKTGESLWSIAKKYSTTIEAIQGINLLKDSQIVENQTLKVPLNVKDSYIVQAGDTLSQISIKTNISVQEIKSFNRLQTDQIFPLQILNIPKHH